MPYDIELASAPEMIFDELNSFCDHFHIYLDDMDIVHGDMLPTDVMQLGYRLLAYAISARKVSNMNSDIIVLDSKNTTVGQGGSDN